MGVFSLLPLLRQETAAMIHFGALIESEWNHSYQAENQDSGFSMYSSSSQWRL